jgi:hypothetical protein
MIQFHLANSPLHWVKRHVKGHQDSHTQYSELDVISQANVDVDHLAKLEWNQDWHIDLDAVLPGQCWRVKNNITGERIQGDVDTSLRRIFMKRKCRSIGKENFAWHKIWHHKNGPY